MDFEKLIHNILYQNHKIDPDTGCWIYTGEIDSGTGYGRVMIDGTRYHTHRLSAAFHLGLDLNNPKEFACHHRQCFNRACWNPTHLYIGDNQSNQLDKVNNTCKKGHALIGNNVMIRKRASGKTYRNCRICHNTRSLNAYHETKLRKIIG